MDHIKPDGVTYVRTLAKTHSGGVILCLLDYIIIETHVRTYVCYVRTTYRDDRNINTYVIESYTIDS